MEFMSAKEAANKWGISQRRVAILCSENRVGGAQMIGKTWIIPAEAEKPMDARITRYKTQENETAKPFLKWAGGKTQLLSEIEKYYPFQLGKITKYAEPYIGGGAVLFDILNKYKLEEVYISDINAELVNTYCVVRDDVDSLVTILRDMENEYISLDSEKRKQYYTAMRSRFNEMKVSDQSTGNINKAALMIFLNKTCFNGLFRVNKKGLFNVPIGAYKKPVICDEKNLRLVSKKLQNVKIVHGDYRKCLGFVDDQTFVYFDPPYRPLTCTSNFTSYTESVFDDKAQLELAEYVDCLHKKGTYILVSNSDPKNTDPKDDFFEKAYEGYYISQIDATRMINSNSKGRGKIKELLISNFVPEESN